MLTNDTSLVKIRLHGIDAPEKDQPFYKASKQYLSNLVGGMTVRVIHSGRDRYGRTLGIAYLDSSNINELLLSAGMVWHFKRYDNHSAWAKLEIEARLLKRGLWLDKVPVPPWEWRSKKRNRAGNRSVVTD